jgi:hypothetical protein
MPQQSKRAAIRGPSPKEKAGAIHPLPPISSTSALETIPPCIPLLGGSFVGVPISIIALNHVTEKTAGHTTPPVFEKQTSKSAERAATIVASLEFISTLDGM